MRSVVKLKRTEILESSGPLRLEVEASRLPLDNDVTVVSETCPVELQVSWSGSQARVRGIVDTILQETCDRCMTPFDDELSVQFTLILTEKESLYSGEAEDVYVFSPTQEEFDFGPVMADAIRLERPMKQLCNEDCKGLCTRCGTNLNETDCECRENTVDDRWAPLKALLQPESGR